MSVKIDGMIGYRVAGQCILIVSLCLAASCNRSPRTAAPSSGSAPPIVDIVLHGVNVRFADGPSVFPYLWQQQSPKVQQVLPEKRRAALSWLGSELAKYPSGFLQKHVSTIFLFGAIQLAGFDYMGTYEPPSTVYFCFVPTEGIRAMEIGLHGELSSLLYYKYRNIVSEVGLTFRVTDSEDVASATKSLIADDVCLSKGYLFPYAMSSPEEDFNSIAGALFAGDAQLWSYSKRIAKLGQKVDKIIRFYQIIDSRFSKTFFERIRK